MNHSMQMKSKNRPFPLVRGARRCFWVVVASLLAFAGLDSHAISDADLSLFRYAANLGNAEAQFNLGLCYDEGEGVAVDKAEAAKWYRKAADQGHAGARRALDMLQSME
ncbi:MAG: tetratricopeptide repeat protein [Kiritimatiellia bacterium]